MNQKTVYKKLRFLIFVSCIVPFSFGHSNPAYLPWTQENFLKAVELLEKNPKTDCDDAVIRAGLGYALLQMEKTGSKHSMQTLLSKGLNLSKCRVNTFTFLNNCMVDSAIFLYEQGIDKDAEVMEGSAPLHLVAEARCRPLVEYFVLKGADINAPKQKNQWGSVISSAVLGGDVEIVNYLLKHGVDPDAGAVSDDAAYGEDTRPVYLAVRDGHLQILKSLFEFKANFNPAEGLLAKAALNAEVEMTRFLLSHPKSIALSLKEKEKILSRVQTKQDFLRQCSRQKQDSDNMFQCTKKEERIYYYQVEERLKRYGEIIRLLKSK